MREAVVQAGCGGILPGILTFEMWDEEFKARLGYVRSQLKLHETLSQKKKKGRKKKGKKEAM